MENQTERVVESMVLDNDEVVAVMSACAVVLQFGRRSDLNQHESQRYLESGLRKIAASTGHDPDEVIDTARGKWDEAFARNSETAAG